MPRSWPLPAVRRTVGAGPVGAGVDAGPVAATVDVGPIGAVRRAVAV
ncbi:hypothetical protein [Streptomyces sp. XD-27]|nr:hypothetical protein [Streptomyces sp. XD-27]WKX69836.1 hypothetical protein Q3Y56_07855 [Streptomyces sp. XD-27]